MVTPSSIEVMVEHIRRCLKDGQAAIQSEYVVGRDEEETVRADWNRAGVYLDQLRDLAVNGRSELG